MWEMPSAMWSVKEISEGWGFWLEGASWGGIGEDDGELVSSIGVLMVEGRM